MRRILLDEMMPHPLGVTLERRGWDVLEVVRGPGLRGMDDPDVLALAASQERTLITLNVRDFMSIIAQWSGQQRSHGPVWMLASATFPTGPHQVAAIERALVSAEVSGLWPVPGTAMFLPPADDR